VFSQPCRNTPHATPCAPLPTTTSQPPGAPLALPKSAPSAVKLTSNPIKFEVVDVSSKQANAVTDDQWNAYRGMAGDSFPEVPPDGAGLLDGGGDGVGVHRGNIIMH